jgi:hypothetical protein
MRAVAVSYATVNHAPPASLHRPAHALSSRIIKRLVDSWGIEPYGLRSGEVDLYTVNVPMIETLLSSDGVPVCWTALGRNAYGRLFKALPSEQAAQRQSVKSGGPDAPGAETTSEQVRGDQGDSTGAELVFKWAPDMTGVLNPDKPVEGSDTWALAQGWACVTPLMASFAEPESYYGLPFDGDEPHKVWKMKL